MAKAETKKEFVSQFPIEFTETMLREVREMFPGTDLFAHSDADYEGIPIYHILNLTLIKVDDTFYGRT
jgi:hypothetical protein